MAICLAVWGGSAAPAVAQAAPEARIGASAVAVAGSPRPRPRAMNVDLALRTEPPPTGPDARLSPRPRARPEALTVAVSPQLPPSGPDAQSAHLVLRSPRPAPRPARIVQAKRVVVAAVAAPPASPPAAAEQPKGGFLASIFRPAPGGNPVAPTRGAACGDPAIIGETLSPVVGRTRGCGIANPVRVTSVAGVRLSQPALIDCSTAKALKSWVVGAVKPAFDGMGGGVARLEVAAHYSCRTMNNRKGAALSFHAKGMAIDIAGITLVNGQSLSVLKDWRGSHSAKMKAVYRAACGTFGTTLGPGSDGYHEDHWHLDTVPRRNGAYCR